MNPCEAPYIFLATSILSCIPIAKLIFTACASGF